MRNTPSDEKQPGDSLSLPILPLLLYLIHYLLTQLFQLKFAPPRSQEIKLQLTRELRKSITIKKTFLFHQLYKATVERRCIFMTLLWQTATLKFTTKKNNSKNIFKKLKNDTSITILWIWSPWFTIHRKQSSGGPIFKAVLILNISRCAGGGGGGTTTLSVGRWWLQI